MEYLDLMEEGCRRQREAQRNLSQKKKLQTAAAVRALFLLESHHEGVCEHAQELLSSGKVDCEQTSPPALAEVLLHPMPSLLTHVT